MKDACELPRPVRPIDTLRVPLRASAASQTESRRDDQIIAQPRVSEARAPPWVNAPKKTFPLSPRLPRHSAARRREARAGRGAFRELTKPPEQWNNS